MNTTIIGFSGAAQAGKDTACNILLAELEKCNPSINVVRYAFADELKMEVRNFCISQYDINPFNLSPKDKELIRPLLIFHGNIMRHFDEDYWLKKVIDKIERNEPDIAIITDVRYENEARWVKKNGALFHIEKTGQKIKDKFEAKNIPVLKKMALDKIVWEENKKRTYQQNRKILAKSLLSSKKLKKFLKSSPQMITII